VAKKSEAWTKDGGQFIPAPLTWLNQARWEAPTEAQIVAEQEADSWHESRAGVDRKAVELGMPAWDEYSAERIRKGVTPHYGIFKLAIVEAAKKASKP